MIDNKIDFASFIKSYDESLFYETISELEENDILFEGQFPCLDDMTMRDRNFDMQKQVFEKYGYAKANSLNHFSFEVKGEGWMHCFVVFGDIYTTMAEVKNAVISHFSAKK